MTIGLVLSNNALSPSKVKWEQALYTIVKYSIYEITLYKKSVTVIALTFVASVHPLPMDLDTTCGVRGRTTHTPWNIECISICERCSLALRSLDHQLVFGTGPVYYVHVANLNA